MLVFKNKVAVITGGARGIGKCIREQFEAAGAKVCVIDLLPVGLRKSSSTRSTTATEF